MQEIQQTLTSMEHTCKLANNTVTPKVMYMGHMYTQYCYAILWQQFIHV